MSEQKPCVRCERPIDSSARSCVYCGWDQALPRPAETATPPIANPYTPPPDNRIRNRLLGASAFVVLVILAFFIGSLLNRSEGIEAEKALNPSPQAGAGSSSRTTVMLVPVDGTSPLQEQPPVTSAPAPPASAGSAEINGERSDATALPSGAYSVAVERARAEREKRPNAGIVDPRTIAGALEPRPTHRAESTAAQTADAQRAGNIPAESLRTQPVPLYQPVPSMQVYRPENARLILTVGSEGRVRGINITQSIPGEMPRIIAAVQNWRFRPATENGRPVTSSFAVDITVRPR
jgi:hypothetical protein